MYTAALAAVAVASPFATAASLPSDVLRQVEQAISESTQHLAPVMSPVAPIGKAEAAASYWPVVFLHGMGDSGSNSGMKSLCKTASDKYPGLYSVCSNVADGMSSITTELAVQVQQFVTSVRADPKLKNGFTAVGLSQGNLVLRAYIEQVNDPPVHKFVSMCGPHAGEGTCPDNLLYKAVCPIWETQKYTAPVAFSDYWKDHTNQAEYLNKSRWLADVNNERPAKNQTYALNMGTLHQYVLVEATKDTIVEPHQSEEHGFWAWGKGDTVESLRDTEGYKGDWIGLQTLDKAGNLTILTYPADHLRWSDQFWNDNILPIFAN